MPPLSLDEGAELPSALTQKTKSRRLIRRPFLECGGLPPLSPRYSSTTSTTRRFAERPSRVLFDSTGRVSP
jgi:hypothetical protein